MAPVNIENFLACYISLSAISMFFSAIVITSGLLRPSMISPKRPFTHIIFAISLCDFLGSIGNVLGFPRNGSVACTVQAFLYLFFFPASWFWTAALVYQLRCVAIHNKIWLRVRYLHMLCWTIPLILALAPLSTNTYGQDDYLEGSSVCNVGGNSLKAYNWSLGDTGSEFLLCFVLMMFHVIEIGLFFRKNKELISDSKKSLFCATRLYPLGMLVAWLPFTIVEFYYSSGNYKWRAWELVQLLSTQYGTFLGLIYFVYSKQARDIWIGYPRRLLFRIVGKTGDEESNSFINNSSIITANAEEEAWAPEDDRVSWGIRQDRISKSELKKIPSSKRAVLAEGIELNPSIRDGSSKFGSTPPSDKFDCKDDDNDNRNYTDHRRQSANEIPQP